MYRTWTIQTCWISCNVEGHNFVPRRQNFFAKTGMPHEENYGCNMSPVHVPKNVSSCVPTFTQSAHSNIRNGYETWQSSLLYVFVGPFGGWPAQNLAKYKRMWCVLIQPTEALQLFCNPCIVNEHKTKDAQGQRPSIINIRLFVCFPEFCQDSKSFLSINYDLAKKESRVW